MVVLGVGPSSLLTAGIWRRLGAHVLFFQAGTRDGGRKAPHFRGLLTAVSLAAVRSVADSSWQFCTGQPRAQRKLSAAHPGAQDAVPADSAALRHEVALRQLSEQ